MKTDACFHPRNFEFDPENMEEEDVDAIEKRK